MFLFCAAYYGPQHPKQVQCTFNSSALSAEQTCAVDVANFGPCSQAQGFGYRNGAPCIFLKLNKIFNWVPQVYDNPLDLPADMPEDLQRHIQRLPREQRQQVWVSCRGENPADREVLGPVKFYPQPGFAAFYYPYTNKPGYSSPLVAVQLQRPECE